jgi:tetratricopeptide (TPR) repeat protein
MTATTVSGARRALRLTLPIFIVALSPSLAIGSPAAVPFSFPQSDATPEDVLKLPPGQQKSYYQQILAARPHDLDALEGLARTEAALKDFPAAIAAYRTVLSARPDDHDARIQTARLLGWNNEYDNSIKAFRAVLAGAPDDPEALDGLAHVQVWSGKIADAAVTYGRLANLRPNDTVALFAAARLEAATHQYPAARARLTSLLAFEPGNDDARLLLAQLELKQGQYQSCLRQFDRVLERRPADADALLGAAQSRYYLGDLGKAADEAGEVVARQLRNFDAIFLLASIERARGHRAQAKTLLDRAERLAPHNSETAGLRENIWAESSTVLHLTAGFAREVGTSAPGVPADVAEEDLRTLTLGSRLDFNSFPHSTSSLSFDVLPIESPSGFFGGVAAPSEFLYRQTTRITSHLTVRGGAGLEHLGPGAIVNLPAGFGPQPGASGSIPIGFAGASFALNEHISLDFTWSHLGITYTPLATRLGVVDGRLEGGVNVIFDPGDSLHLSYFEDHFTSEAYQHELQGPEPGSAPTVGPTAADGESGSGGALTFNRRLVRRERLGLDLGWSVLVDGYNGPRRNVDLGFFTPSFYQRELLNADVHGQLTKRIGYDLLTAAGVQQVGNGQAVKRALQASPALTFRLTPYLSCKAGYTYYDSAQSLGLVRGNSAQLGIDWRF